MAEKEKNAVSVVSYMMIITLAGKILGLVRDQLLAKNYGVGMEANAFMSASLIPRTFFDVIFASAISASFIPIFNQYMEQKGKKAAFRLSNNFITIIGLLTAVLTVLGIVLAGPLTGLFVNYTGETAALCTSLLRWMFPLVLFTGIAYCFVGILQSLDEFGIPAAMSIVSNGIIIVYFIFFNHRFGVYGLASAFLLGWAMQAVMQIPSLWKKGFRYRPCFDLKDEGVKQVFALMLPVMVSTWVQPINIAINNKFASSLYNGAGSSSINFANTLYTIIVGVFVLSMANVLFPRLSRLTGEEGKDQFGAIINNSMSVLIFLLIPMTIGLMSLSEPLVRLIYERNEFDVFATSITSQALFYLSIGMLGFGVQTILSRAYYAEQDGKTPLISGVASIISNILLCLLLVDKMGIGGLALASALASMVSALFLIVPMQRKIKNLIDKEFCFKFMKILVSSLIMAALVILVKNVILIKVADGLIARFLAVALPACVGVFAYMVLTWMLKVSEARLVFDIARNMLKKIRRV